jgi:S-DNA-T family DNA segregation ATPase FtsK/SpoIIIE
MSVGDIIALIVLGASAWGAFLLLRAIWRWLTAEQVPSKLKQIQDEWPTRHAPAAKLDGSSVDDMAGYEFGWTATLKLRPGQTRSEAQKATDRLESTLRVRPRSVWIEEHPERADWSRLRVVEKDPHAEPIPWEGPSLTSILERVELGPYQTGEMVRVSLAYQHMVIAGETGSGKSGLVNLVVGELATCPDAEVWGIDFKGGMELKPWESRLAELATTPEEAKALFDKATARIKERQRVLAGNGRLWRPTPEQPAIVIVVDEQAELAKADSKTLKLSDAQDTVARTGRALAVTQVLALQRAIQSELGSAVVRQQAGIKILMRVEEPEEADVILGNGSAAAGWTPDRLGQDGSFLIRAKQQGLNVPRPARAFWVSDARVRQLARGSV